MVSSVPSLGCVDGKVLEELVPSTTVVSFIFSTSRLLLLLHNPVFIHGLGYVETIGNQELSNKVMLVS